MADKIETVVILDPAEINRRAAEERQRAIEAGEVQPFDKTVPGGKYQTADGRWHDAHGREITEDGDLASDTPWELPPAPRMAVGGPEVTDAHDEGDEEDWRSDMRDQRRASIAEPVEGAPLTGDTVLPPLEDEPADKPKRRRRKK